MYSHCAKKFLDTQTEKVKKFYMMPLFFN